MRHGGNRFVCEITGTSRLMERPRGQARWQGKNMKHQNAEFSARRLSITRDRGWFALLLVAVVLTTASVAGTQTPAAAVQAAAPPFIFFTDLTSGPNSGGESVSGFAGAYVTIYGNNFGATQGTSTVTLNGANCLRVVSWGSAWLWYQKIVVQLGSSCTTGDFVVTLGSQASKATQISVGGTTVDNAKFTVRSGNIYCVSTAGSDSNSGHFPSSCWRSISHCCQAGGSVLAGDTVYVEDGVSLAPGGGGVNDTLSIGVTGTVANPVGLIACPQASSNTCGSAGGSTLAAVTIGTPTGDQRGILVCSGLGACSSGQYWTFAGLLLRGTNEAFQAGSDVSGIRLIANDMYCPNGNSPSGCADISMLKSFAYGNSIHDTAVNVPGSVTKQYHSIYIGDGTIAADWGWNSVTNNHGNRGFQLFTSGAGIADVHVHDNLIHDNRGIGIFLSNVSPTSTQPVEAYNNVVYNAGLGPDFNDGASVYDCAEVDTSGTGTSPSLFYNNTLYNCGAGGGGAIFASPTGKALIQNNIIYNTRAYFDPSSNLSNTSCANNLYFGNGTASTCTTGAVNLDPQFVNVSGLNFHLALSSPGDDAGVTIAGLQWDHDGISRPQGSAYDIGAYEYFAGGSTVQTPNPPTNLTILVQ
jgi:hypothetical protein